MTDIALLEQDLTAHIALIANKTISAHELAALQLDWIHRVNPKINAFISVAASSFVDAGDVSHLHTDHPEPLRGAALAVKDNIDVAGFTTTAGLAIRKEAYAQQDAFVVQKLRRAGATFSGKLNMSEGAMGASNHNAHFGHCYNPHDLNRTPGGSSGGSAAAVAAGMTALALGTDTMGSVRIPASYCGLFGFKASRGAISNGGAVPCGRVMDNIGPIARSARDLSLAFDIMQGFDVSHAESKRVSYLTEPNDSPVLLVPANLAGLGVTADVQADFAANLQAFKDLGCQIKTFDFGDYNFGAARRAGLIICETDMRHFHADAWEHRRTEFSPYLRALLSYIDGKTPMDVMRAELTLEGAVVKSRELFAQGDYLFDAHRTAARI